MSILVGLLVRLLEPVEHRLRLVVEAAEGRAGGRACGAIGPREDRLLGEELAVELVQLEQHVLEHLGERRRRLAASLQRGEQRHLRDGARAEAADQRGRAAERRLARRQPRLLGRRTVGGTGKERLERCLLYTSPSPRDGLLSRMPSSA